MPSWNHAYFIGHNRLIKTEDAKAFQEAVGYSYHGDFHEGDVEMLIEFWRHPIIDCDNCGKLIPDALQMIAYKNDKQIVDLCIRRYRCKPGEDRVFVSVNHAESL